MSAERRKVLEMLAAGKLSAQEAEKLLDKLTASASEQTAAGEKTEEGCATATKKHRFMRIVVERPGQDQVNIRMPLSFTRTGSRLLAVLPSRVSEKLAELGVNIAALGAMNPEEWAEAVEQTNIEVERGDGKKVRIFCE